MILSSALKSLALEFGPSLGLILLRLHYARNKIISFSMCFIGCCVQTSPWLVSLQYKYFQISLAMREEDDNRVLYLPSVDMLMF